MKMKILFLVLSMFILTMINIQITKADANGCCVYISSGSGVERFNANTTLSNCQTYSSTTSWKFYSGDVTADCSNHSSITPITGSKTSSATDDSKGCCLYQNSQNSTDKNWYPVPGVTQNTCNSYPVNKFVAGDLNCSSASASATSGAQCCVDICNDCIKASLKASCDTVGGTLKGSADCSDVSGCNSVSDTYIVNRKTCPTSNTPGAATPGSTNPSANATTGTSATISFTNPLQYNTVQDLLTKGLLPALQGIIVVLAIIFIIIGGILYITSAGDDKRMETAKACITGALIGLALAIAAPSFLKQISIILNWNGASGIGGMTLAQIALRVLDFLLGIVGILAIIMMIVGGVTYLTSTGDEDRIDSAKKIITYAIIGIAVSLAALVIVRQIATLLT